MTQCSPFDACRSFLDSGCLCQGQLADGIAIEVRCSSVRGKMAGVKGHLIITVAEASGKNKEDQVLQACSLTVQVNAREIQLAHM